MEIPLYIHVVIVRDPSSTLEGLGLVVVRGFDVSYYFCNSMDVMTYKNGILFFKCAVVCQVDSFRIKFQILSISFSSFD